MKGKHQRRRARSLIVQSLYQWQVGEMLVEDILDSYEDRLTSKRVDGAYVRSVFPEIVKTVQELDEHFAPYLQGRTREELTPVEQAVLRLGTYEMTQKLEIPYRVVIDEAIEQAKQFGSSDGYKYINGVLDQMAKSARAAEMGGAGQSE